MADIVIISPEYKYLQQDPYWTEMSLLSMCKLDVTMMMTSFQGCDDVSTCFLKKML